MRMSFYRCWTLLKQHDNKPLLSSLRPVIMKLLLWKSVSFSLLVILLNGCVSSPPRNASNVCEIFEDKRSWYRAAKAAEARWGAPMSVSMAVLYQESSFKARAKPARGRFLWIIPWARPSSAYGYAQALDSTWQDYERQSGNRGASRSNFGDAIDFVGWYNSNSNRISGISRNNGRDLYLAYHEGNGGYQQGTYREKRWLLDAAAQVQANANRFESQLSECRRDLDKNWFWRLVS
jgi:hypothetical protein